VELCEQLREIPGASGLHLMSIRADAAILEVIERLGLDPRPASAVASPRRAGIP
jgi:hypothetical protein